MQALEGNDLLALDGLERIAGSREDEVALFDAHNRARAAGTIGFASLRGGSVAGDHTVHFLADDERIALTHLTYNRHEFTLFFEPLPKSVQVFDLHEIIPEPRGWHFPAIRRNQEDVYWLDLPN